MKKFDITVSLGIIILCVLLMIMVGLRSSDRGGTAPSYRFLAGREPVNFKKAKTGNEDIRYTYSFEADFNDICSKADVELIPAGFSGKTDVIDIPKLYKFTIRSYHLKGKFPRGPIDIRVHNNDIKYIVFTDSKKGVKPIKDGWVTVEVVYYRGWRWPF